MEVGVTIPYYMPTSLVQNADLATYAQPEVKFYRDLIKAAVDPGDTGNDYRVSEIAQWQGLDATVRGFFFLVEERDGAGVPTGPQFIFITGHDSNSAPGPFLQHFIGANNPTTVLGYASFFAQNTTPGTTQAPLTIGFLSHGGTRRSRITVGSLVGSHNIGDVVRNNTSTKFGIIRDIVGSDWVVEHTMGPKWAAADSIVNVTTAGTAAVTTEIWRSFVDVGWSDFDTLRLGTGGAFGDTDFTAPATSPYSSLSGFAPLYASSAPFVNYKWRVSEATIYATSVLYQLAFNNALHTMTAYGWRGHNHEILQDYCIFGELFENQNGNAVYVYGTVGVKLGYSDTGYAQTNEFIESQYSGDGTGTAGLYATYSSRSHANYTLNNTPHLTDTTVYPWTKIFIYSTTDAKGWINPDISRVQGAYQRMKGLRPTKNGHTCIKIHEANVTPWATNIIPGLVEYSQPSTFRNPGSWSI